MYAKPRIMIVEDHTLLRAGLRALLTQRDEFEVVGDFDNPRDAIPSLVALAPDLILLDLSMPGMNGIEAITEIRLRQLEVRILVLTIQRSEESIKESLRAGANGYLLKSASLDELRTAISNVLTGKTYLSPDISEQFVTGYLGRPAVGDRSSPWSVLTHREREVLKLVAEGHPNRSTAQFLSLSIKTVEKHRANLMRKLALHNASELTAYAIDRGLVERPSSRLHIDALLGGE
jgi:DNA-binding NarL/FixJ family response regulator